MQVFAMKGWGIHTKPIKMILALLSAALLSAALLSAALLSACTVVPINQSSGSGSGSAPVTGGQFNATNYVESIWSSKVVPTVTSKAVDLQTLLPAIKKNPDAASQKYGTQLNGSYHFMVKGQGKVTKVDTSTPNGTITVEVPYPGGSQAVTVQIGPQISGESLRDAVGFIQFGNFTNQIDYGSVSGALDDKVAKDVTGKLNPAQLQGTTVSFYGTFTLDDPKNIVITPVKLDVK